MIQPNEFRIGNLVYLFDNKPFIIGVISKKVIQVNGGGIGGEVFCIENVSPIPLTPEVLEKCGAKNPANNDPYGGVLITINELVSIRLLPLLDGTGYYWDNFNCSYKVILKYLHQLQNLYFALTGEELEYKP